MASYLTGFWILLKENTLEGNHFCKVNPEVLGYFLIAVDLESINQMLILSNVMTCTSNFSVLLNDLGVQLYMKINKKYPRNQKLAREADLITGASLIKFTDPGVPGGRSAILKMPTSAPCPNLCRFFVEGKMQMAISNWTRCLSSLKIKDCKLKP